MAAAHLLKEPAWMSRNIFGLPKSKMTEAQFNEAPITTPALTVTEYCLRDPDDPAIWTILLSPPPECRDGCTTILGTPAQQVPQLVEFIKSLHDSVKGLSCARAPISDIAFIPPSPSSRQQIKEAREIVLAIRSSIFDRQINHWTLQDDLNAHEQEARRHLPVLGWRFNWVDLAKWDLYVLRLLGIDVKDWVLKPRVQLRRVLADVECAREWLRREGEWLKEVEDAMRQVQDKLESAVLCEKVL
ncbi:MAG: hypothetical protein Q9220_007221 [cf. Caloplaca sp. 1 TL-2023]